MTMSLKSHNSPVFHDGDGDCTRAPNRSGVPVFVPILVVKYRKYDLFPFVPSSQTAKIRVWINRNSGVVRRPLRSKYAVAV